MLTGKVKTSVICNTKGKNEGVIRQKMYRSYATDHIMQGQEKHTTGYI